MRGLDTSVDSSLRIALLGPMAPFRGGIAQFNDRLRKELTARGHEILPVTFSRQYPEFLFPGTSQYDEALTGDALALVDSLNPFSWRKAGRRIRDFAPDALVVAYWTPHLSPALTGVVKASRTSAIGLVHNAMPHQPFPFSQRLVRSFLRHLEGVLALSDHVREAVVREGFSGRSRVINHPPYDHFGAPMSREEARNQLGVQPTGPLLLCFGLVRQYKGFGTAVRALEFVVEALPEAQLLIAGEAYGEDVGEDLEALPASVRARVRRDARYIPDEEVSAYFSAADLLLLPYERGTQSGPLAISEHFGLPAVVNDVGGLGEAVRASGAGLVTSDPGPEPLARAVVEALDPVTHASLRAAAAGRSSAQGWSRLAFAIEDLATA